MSRYKVWRTATGGNSTPDRETGGRKGRAQIARDFSFISKLQSPGRRGHRAMTASIEAGENEQQS